jgi:hypothetical protein
LEWWDWCHDEEVIKPNRENVMARRKVVKVEEVNETEVQEEEVNETEVQEEEVQETEKTAESLFVLKQKTKYNSDDEKAYEFDVLLDFKDVEIAELYKYSAKSLIIAARPGWKADNCLEDFKKAGRVHFSVREFLDRERSRKPVAITAENLARQMGIPIETAGMVLQAMRDNPQTLQEQISAMVGKTAK